MTNPGPGNMTSRALHLEKEKLEDLVNDMQDTVRRATPTCTMNAMTRLDFIESTTTTSTSIYGGNGARSGCRVVRGSLAQGSDKLRPHSTSLLESLLASHYRSFFQLVP